jgi:hypothetical protein
VYSALLALKEVATAPLTEFKSDAALALNEVYSALDAEVVVANAPLTELKSEATLAEFIVTVNLEDGSNDDAYVVISVNEGGRFLIKSS